MKRKFHYPKLTILVLCIILSYFIFSNPKFTVWMNYLDGLTYLSSFIAGLFFSYGFSTPFAVGFFLKLNVVNPIPVALVAGLGALISDLIIFKLIRLSMMGEFNRIKKAKPFRIINYFLKETITSSLMSYILALLAGIILASPLPDELGISILAGLTRIKIYKLAVISYICNTLGILIMLYF
jgi:hypothetical protein